MLLYQNLILNHKGVIFSKMDLQKYGDQNSSSQEKLLQCHLVGKLLQSQDSYGQYQSASLVSTTQSSRSSLLIVFSFQMKGGFIRRNWWYALKYSSHKLVPLLRIPPKNAWTSNQAWQRYGRNTTKVQWTNCYYLLYMLCRNGL